jgi:valyl-tRNA synthetase
LQQAIAEDHAAVQDYRFDQMAQALYEFTWNEFCDWYLELAKPVLTDPASSKAAQRGTRQTLVQTLETLLRLLHPLMPFLTEEIWQRVAPLAGVSGDTIMRQPYPEADKALIDATRAVADIEWLRQFLLGVRRIRAEMNIAPWKTLAACCCNTAHRRGSSSGWNGIAGRIADAGSAGIASPGRGEQTSQPRKRPLRWSAA